MTDPDLRCFRTSNAGPFTLDGTRTWVVGRSHPAIIDPGPDEPDHVSRVAEAVADAHRVTVLLTHGHGDHAGGLDRLLELLGRHDRARGVHGGQAVSRGRTVSVRGSGAERARPLSDGEEVATDAGLLRALHTPGHTRDHLAFHWPSRRALFAGDHLLGEGDTTWVAEYTGCVSDYLDSLRKVRELDLEVIHPAHGPSLTDPAAAVDRFEAHRRERIRQVRRALEARPTASDEELLEDVYGGAVPDDLRGAALQSLRALRHYVESSES